MKLTLGTNIAAMKAQRQLSNGSNDLSRVFERLASGQRINRASDDAAGLAIADTLNADVRVYTQGIRNLNDGLSVLNIADGALQELTNITFRLTELAEQAANGTLGAAQRSSLNEEAQALKAEYFRIAKSTEFNGRKLFEGDYGVLSLQAGYGTNSSISSGLGGAIGTGTFDTAQKLSTSGEPAHIASADLNGDGYLDLALANNGDKTLDVFLGSKEGSFTQVGSTPVSSLIPFGSPTTLHFADFNGDGHFDVATVGDDIAVLIGNGDGTFQNEQLIDVGFNPAAATIGDFNNDGKIDIAASTPTGAIAVVLGNGDGTFTVSATSIPSLGDPQLIKSADFNGDGLDDLVTSNYFNSNVSVLLSNGDGSFQTATTYDTNAATYGIAISDLNNDGIVDLVTTDFSSNTVSVMLGVGDGSFQSAKSYVASDGVTDIAVQDFDGDGNNDVAVTGYTSGELNILLGNGDGTLQEAASYSSGASAWGITAGDFNLDGVYDIATTNFAEDTISVFFAKTQDGVSPLLEFSLNTMAEAKQALSQFTHKLEQLSKQRGQIGAFQSRIEVASNVLSASAENYKAAESRIRDADIAQESANLVRLQILQQAASAVLAQANQQPQLVLQLLRGGA